MTAHNKLTLTGRRFGRLLVIEEAEKRNGKIHWKCVCDCGGTSIAATGNLRSGKHVSCGCYRLERLREEMKGKSNIAHTTHGMTRDRKQPQVYRAWQDMKDRCLNENNRHFKNYGGRGVFVCDGWLESFENFHRDMGNPPSKKHSLDRVNNDGPYSPENCRWADKKTQSNNKRNTRYLSHNGERIPLAAASRKYGIPMHNLSYWHKTKNQKKIDAAITAAVNEANWR